MAGKEAYCSLQLGSQFRRTCEALPCLWRFRPWLSGVSERKGVPQTIGFPMKNRPFRSALRWSLLWWPLSFSASGDVSVDDHGIKATNFGSSQVAFPMKSSRIHGHPALPEQADTLLNQFKSLESPKDPAMKISDIYPLVQ